MTRPYDAAAKDLVELDPAGLLRYLGFEVSGTVTVRNSDLTTVVAESDRILIVDEDPPWIAHVEIQANADADLDLRVDRYNLLIEYRERLPVVSAILLLRPEADHPSLTGHRVQQKPNGEIYRDFSYHVIRAWQQPLAFVLEGPSALLPLASLTGVSEKQVASVVERIEARLAEIENSVVANQLRTDAAILMGLRFSAEVIKSCPWRTDSMRESTFYQAILEEGRNEEAKRLVFRLGTTRFGEPGPEVVEFINAIKDPGKLELLAEHILTAQDWEELVSE